MTTLREKLVFLLSNKKNIRENGVNIYYWTPKWLKENIGDYLNIVISNELLKRQGIDPKKHIKKTRYMYGIGSIFHVVRDNATIWGSGVNGMCNTENVRGKNLDIRLVRGRLTRDYLQQRGIPCPELYGDPGLIVSRLFPEYFKIKKNKDVVIVPNLFDLNQLRTQNKLGLPIIMPTVYRWRTFFKEICSAKLVIASSLHGIIIAESYGIPAVYLKLNKNEGIDFKFHDYYSGTGREMTKVAHSVEEALELGGEPLPEIPAYIEDVFPYDLWSS